MPLDTVVAEANVQRYVVYTCDSVAHQLGQEALIMWPQRQATMVVPDEAGINDVSCAFHGRIPVKAAAC
jgi:hypothetical protein